MTTLQTTCPYCGVGCGVVVENGALGGDRGHPANFGRLCSKGAALEHTLALPDRLTVPLMRGREASWDESLDFIAAEFTRIRETHGPDAIAFYVSGQFLTEDYYVANKLMKGFIGSANIDTNSRLCMASSVAGHVRAFGEDIVPGCYEDLEEADLVLQVGANMAWCHPVLYQRLMVARDMRGTKIVNIDPRRTVTAETADLHLPLAPGTDVLLFNGLLTHLAEVGALDHDWLAAHVSGFDEALDAARRSVPSIAFVAAAADLAAEDVRAFYDLFARTERVVTLYSQGVNQSVSGADKVNAILNCHLAAGRIGRAGMGPFSLTGQPNAMGGREVGGLANQLAAHMAFAPADVDRVRRFWSAPNIASRPGHKAVDMFEAVADGRVKAIWIAATNPADSMPRAGRVREALAKCPLVIVSDAWPTDTTALAHLVLPAAAWAEKDGTVTNSERRISRQRAFRAAPGAARPDWWMFAQVARRMGWEREFSYASAADIFREHAALSSFENEGARVFDIGALATLDAAAYDALAPVQWPCQKLGGGRSGPRLFGQGGFPTPDRRARMIPIVVRSEGRPADNLLTLNTGRIRDQWHTMTRTGRVPHLMTHIAGPRLALHPRDAAARGIEDGGLARIASPHGTAVLRVTIDAAMRTGDVFAPMHWTDQFSSAGPIDRLAHAVIDPVSGQPDLKGTRVQVVAVAESWRGLLLRRSAGDLAFGENVHWSKAPIATGFAFELSGHAPLAELVVSEQALRRLLRAPAEAELVSYSDPKRSVFRYAALLDRRLEACVFFATPRATFAEADRAAQMLGRILEPTARLSLLAGVEACVAHVDKIVCSCFSVGESAIRAAIRAGKFISAAEIGAALRAGTNCGSCVPELKKLLTESAQLHEAA
ncbi:nitrate reductase [Methylocapsa acidiphila]|uniref:nitrate reductase n=1 Tax=Methylocapsa acidiphila TaxID=133552 RepID=UPI000428632F|nr:nitrate reductase [Methylocapsa acidiphila]